jgi:hypothetical protein
MVGIALLSVRNVFVESLVPALAPLLEQLARWIAANRDIVAARTVEWITGLAERVREFSVNLPALLDRMERWGEVAKRVWDAFDGLKGVLIIIGAVAIAPLVAAVAGLMLALGKFGLIAAAIAGLGYGLYKAWEPLKAFFTDLFTGIADLAQAAWDKIKPIVDGARELLRSMQGTGEALSGRVLNPTMRRANPIEGWDDPDEPAQAPAPLFRGPAVPPQVPEFRTPAIPPPAERQQLLRPQGFRPSATTEGNLAIEVNFNDLPREARVNVERSGSAPEPTVNVGFAALGVP